MQHADLARLGEALELVEQPRLADPGLSADEHELGLAGHGSVQPLLQLRRLARAPDERHQRRPRRLQRRVSPVTGALAVAVAEPRAVALQRLRHFSCPLRPLRRAPSAGSSG